MQIQLLSQSQMLFKSSVCTQALMHVRCLTIPIHIPLPYTASTQYPEQGWRQTAAPYLQEVTSLAVDIHKVIFNGEELLRFTDEECGAVQLGLIGSKGELPLNAQHVNAACRDRAGLCSACRQHTASACCQARGQQG